MADDSIRFTDILTTAAAVANYLGDTEVLPRHVLDAMGIVLGERTMEDLGRPVSPLVPRRPGSGGAAGPLRALVQRWFAQLGGDATATLDRDSLARFRDDVRALVDAAPPGELSGW